MSAVSLSTQDREAFTDQMAAYHQSFGKDFWRLLWTAVAELATGKPVAPEHLAAQANVPLDRTLAIAHEAWEWDPSGERLVGAGLTTRTTRYRVDIDDRTMWTYCAPDTLQLPVMLGQPVHTQSWCPATGEPIAVRVQPTDVRSVVPPTAVVSFPDTSLRPTLADVRRASCDQSSFYRDAQAASEWLATNPRGRLVTVAEAFEVLRVSMLRIKEWLEEPAD